MRNRIIVFLKGHPAILDALWGLAGCLLRLFSIFIPIKQNRIIFASFGGRKFDDSPRAIYEEINKRREFDGWDKVWCFTDPDRFEIPCGRKIKIDSVTFFVTLLSAKVWISNSGMARGIRFHRKKTIEVETWHGTPLKKIGGEENQNSIAPQKTFNQNAKLDGKTIRCAQSKFDQEIFSRVFHARKESILLCDLPRNDKLLQYSIMDINELRMKFGIGKDKKVILYVPTYREYSISGNEYTLSPPVNIEKWKELLGNDYVLIIRAHYTISQSIGLYDDDFVIDASDYPVLNDLYAISDMMISDYSSTYFDYAILRRPMLCFAYDLEEYSQKRGLYVDLESTLPCSIDRNEDEILSHILSLDYVEASKKTEDFCSIYAPNAGHASSSVVDEISKKLANDRG